ncbi:MAG: hypothetical protein WBE84_16260, partial [Xanthobacteraceae bacterium]
MDRLGLVGDYKFHPRQLSDLRIPGLAQKFLKIPLGNAAFRDIIQTLSDLLLEHTKFFRLLEQIRDCGLPHFLGKEFKRFSRFFARRFHNAILSPNR